MNEHNVSKAVKFIKNFLHDMVNEKFPLEKLIISKSLRGFYKNPRTIAHKVLAERMGKRDPGNKPSVGTRIPFAYIQTKGKRLQGDKIEHPDFITKNKLKLDYSIYITNQIMKPIIQVFGLPYVLDNIPAFKRRRKQFALMLRTLRQNSDDETYNKKSRILRDKEVKKLIFDDFLRKSENKKNGNRNIGNFFKKL